MAKEKIAMGINLRLNKNQRNAGYGKYYPVVDRQPTLSLRGFAEHMVSHGAPFSRNVVEGVLMQIVDCLPELVAQGVPVQLDGLGIFYPTAQVVKGAGVESIAAMDGLNPNDIIKAIHLRFLPDATKLDNLCGPTFKKACSLELRNIVDTVTVTLNGKTQKKQTLLPIATAVAQYKEANGGSSGDGASTPSSESSNEGNNSGNNSNSGAESGSGSESVAAPTISGTATFTDSTEVSISGPSGASIYYTTDNTTPTAESTAYSAPFTLTQTTTVRAIAIKDGVSSTVAQKTFTQASGGDGI